MKLTPHFTLEEMTFPEVAARHDLDNAADSIVTANLRLLAGLMEKIRAVLGNKAIVVHSGYRSAAVNRAVGGVDSLAHCHGLACDFVCPAFGTPSQVALATLGSEVEYDQLILEYGWVHVGLAQAGSACRRQVLTKRSPSSAYEAGIRV